MRYNLDDLREEKYKEPEPVSPRCPKCEGYMAKTEKATSITGWQLKCMDCGETWL